MTAKSPSYPVLKPEPCIPISVRLAVMSDLPVHRRLAEAAHKDGRLEPTKQLESHLQRGHAASTFDVR